MGPERCVCCGEIIPEGRLVCVQCENFVHDDITWCIKDDCPKTECRRNLANRRVKKGWYSGTDFSTSGLCLLKGEGK